MIDFMQNTLLPTLLIIICLITTTASIALPILIIQKIRITKRINYKMKKELKKKKKRINASNTYLPR